MNKALGHYTVKGKIYSKKLEAILEANKTNADVEWYFNDSIYNSYDWTIEPQGSLNDYYRLRAQQIRDEYDYVIVMASGGADSTNVVYSFLKNGIHIDEIIAGAPLSGLSNYNWNDKDFSPENTISETKFAQMPLLQEIKTNYPNVKITIHDYFEDMLQYKTDEWVYEASIWLNPTISRHTLDKFSHIKNLAESGKRIAKVYGIDKPTLLITETKNIYSLISDSPVQVGNHDSTDEKYSNLEVVYFYFSPSLVELTIKQSHVLAKYMYSVRDNEFKKTILDRSTSEEYQKSPLRFSRHHRLSGRILYPLIDKFRFQADKNFDGVWHLQDIWIKKLHPNLKLIEQVDSDAVNLVKKINDKYIDKKKLQFKTHYKYWKIGHESTFNKGYPP